MIDNKSKSIGYNLDLGQLFQKLSQNISRLVQHEVQLLKIELEEDISNLIKGSIFLIIGAIFGLFALGVLTVAVILLVDQHLENLLGSSLVVGSIYLVLSFILIMVGKSKAQQAVPLLDESLREAQKNKELIEKNL